MNQQSHSWAHIRKNGKQGLQEIFFMLMFTAALLTISKTWMQPKCPLIDEWRNKVWHIYTMEYYSALKKSKFWHALQRE